MEPLNDDLIQQIRHPPEEQLTIDTPDLHLSLDLFLAIGNASEATYNATQLAIMRRFPKVEILTYYKIKHLVTQISGVSSIERDMCINSCMAYTGPWSTLESCPYCGEFRYEPEGIKIPHKQFTTIPIATRLQALWRTPEGAESMRYREHCTQHNLNELRKNGGQRAHDSVLKD